MGKPCVVYVGRALIGNGADEVEAAIGGGPTVIERRGRAFLFNCLIQEKRDGFDFFWLFNHGRIIVSARVLLELVLNRLSWDNDAEGWQQIPRASEVWLPDLAGFDLQIENRLKVSSELETAILVPVLAIFVFEISIFVAL